MTMALGHLPCPDSLLARLDPRWKLGSITFAILCVALLHSPTLALVALVGAGLMPFLGKTPARWYAARLGEALAFVLFLAVASTLLVGAAQPLWQWGPLTVSWNGIRMAVLLLAKALAILMLLLVLLTSTPLHDLLKAAHMLHVPGLLVQLTLLTYRYIFVIAEELGRIRIALRTRGYRNRMRWHSYRTIGNVAGSLVVRGHERGERVMQAMQCRGFDGRFRSLREFRTGWGDYLFSAIVAGVSLALLVVDLRGR
jgi:cobalt/nickel transport system permease protein